MGGSSKTKSQSTATQTTALNPQYQGVSDDLLKQTQAAIAGQAGTNTTAQGVVNSGLHNLQDTASGKFLDPTTNSVLSNYVNSQQAKYEQELKKQLTQIGNVSGGAFGGSRQGVMEGTALNDYAMNSLNAANSIYYDNYNKERQNQLGAGSTLQTYLDSSQDAAYGGSDQLAKILALLGGYNSTTTSNQSGTQTQSSNPINQAIAIASLFAPK